MKNLIKTTLMLLALLLPATAVAYDFVMDGIYYNINGTEATVTFKGYDNVITGHYSGNVTIPETVTYRGVTYTVTAIGSSAFSYSTDPLSVSIPKTVTSIASFSFSGCSGLTSIKIDAANPKYDSRDNCNAIINTATNKLIAGCQNTIIPNTVTTIGNGAFWGCNSLTSVTMPNSVTVLEVQAFAYCRGLTSLTIGNSVTFIDEDAFGNCSSLKSVTIPSSVNIIGRSAFQDCSSLTDVYSYISDPSKVRCGDRMFYVYLENGNYDYSGRTLHVPQGSVDAYQANSKWCPYFGQIVEMDSETGLKGDVNGDGEVNLADMNAIFDIILGNGYTAAADVNGDGNISIDDVVELVDILVNMPAEPDHECVDLGLTSGTLWATCNIGADSPEEYGDYFAWGETTPKEVYNWSTYQWCNGSMYSLTKYNTNSRLGSVDNKTVLEPVDDAASVNWGPSWCTPTTEQQTELFEECSWFRKTVNGVKGFRIVGPNGNELFLPAAGYCSESSIEGSGSLGSYWSSSCYTSNGISTNAFSACDMGFNWTEYTTYLNGSYHFRYYGHSVRAVRASK